MVTIYNSIYNKCLTIDNKLQQSKIKLGAKCENSPIESLLWGLRLLGAANGTYWAENILMEYMRPRSRQGNIWISEPEKGYVCKHAGALSF